MTTISIGVPDLWNKSEIDFRVLLRVWIVSIETVVILCVTATVRFTHFMRMTCHVYYCEL